MIKSMFSGVAGLRTHQSKMDVIGNNIANVNTYGFKASRATFKESIYQTKNGSSDGTKTLGGSNASQVGYGSQVASIDLLFTAGSYAPTDSPTDVMVDGQGLFLVGEKNLDGELGKVGLANKDGEKDGDLGKLELTRVGDFKFDGQGYLVDSNNKVVYGYVNKDLTKALEVEKNAKLQPIRLHAEKDGSYDQDLKAARINVESISIGKNGEITAVLGKSIGSESSPTVKAQTVITIGQIAIANVTNPNALEKTQGPYYKAKKNFGSIEAFKPGDGGTGSLMSNGLEMANVDLAREFSDMITTQRGFQANTRIITVSDQMLEEIMSIKR